MSCSCIVQFQKISIPTPRKVNGNSKGKGRGGGFKSNLGKYDAKIVFPAGMGGFKLKELLWNRYGYFMEQHIMIIQ